MNTRKNIFEEIVTEFKNQKFVTGGLVSASFIGAVYAFAHVTYSHLYVQTGSRRSNRVGAIDAWEGNRLAATVEVKTMMTQKQVEGLSPLANEVQVRGAIGILAASVFKKNAREAAESLSLIPLGPEEMLSVVKLWDRTKQQLAINSMIYYAGQLERNSALVTGLTTLFNSFDRYP